MKMKVRVEVSRLGLGDDSVRRALELIFYRFGWFSPTRFSSSESNYQAIGERAVLDCMSLLKEDGIELDVKGKGGELYLTVSERKSKMPFGSLSFWATTSKFLGKRDTEQIEDELLEVAKVLRSPHVSAFDEKVQEARNVYREGTTRKTRSHGYRCGLLTPTWRELLGPRISTAMIDGLRKLEGTYSKNMGEGYWLLRPYDRPEDGLTEEGRAREEEIIDVLGRRFFYDFETEREAYFRPGGDTIWSGSIFDGNWP